MEMRPLDRNPSTDGLFCQLKSTKTYNIMGFYAVPMVGLESIKFSTLD